MKFEEIARPPVDIPELMPAESPWKPAQRFFFVTGAHKSGTSWTYWILTSHPEVFCTDEAYFIGREFSVNTWLNEPGFLSWVNSPDARVNWTNGLEDRALIAAAKRGMIESVMKVRARPGAKLIGDKTPAKYMEHVEQLHEIFPDAKLVHIIRDGRDVAVSAMFHHFRAPDRWAFKSDEEMNRAVAYWKRGEGEPVPLFAGPGLWAAAHEWGLCAGKRVAARELYGDSYIEIRYEDMLKDPHAVMARVFTALDIQSDPRLIAECVNRNQFEQLTGRKPGQESRAEFIRKGVSGEWRQYFSPGDKKVFKEVAGRWLIELGYEKDDNW
ncbi:MAG: sulfotransferase [Phycisphaerales bacterium]|nr:sulfotransferase [Phycisphaerales bacterium]